MTHYSFESTPPLALGTDGVLMNSLPAPLQISQSSLSVLQVSWQGSSLPVSRCLLQDLLLLRKGAAQPPCLGCSPVSSSRDAHRELIVPKPPSLRFTFQSCCLFSGTGTKCFPYHLLSYDISRVSKMLHQSNLHLLVLNCQ